MRCSYCGAQTHTVKLCPKTAGGQSARLHLRCSYCGGKDHDVQACLKTFRGNAVRTWRPDDVADHYVKDSQ